jgi:hypothetical protein
MPTRLPNGWGDSMTSSDDYQKLEIYLQVGGGSASYEFNLRLGTQEAMDQVQQSFWNELLGKISNVINHGGLCGANNNPSRSLMIVEPMRSERFLGLTYQVKLKGIDKGAWRVIIGIFVSASERMFPLRRLEMESYDSSDIDLINAARACAIPYPAYQSSIPFELELSEEGDPSCRVIQVQFVSKLGSLLVQEILDTFLGWQICLWGGFPEESDPPLYNGVGKVEVYLANPNTVELVVRDYYGSEAAFNCIISMVLWIHLQRSLVRKVIME